MMLNRALGFDLARALSDPTAVFGSPEEVLNRSDLSTESKIEILCRWAYDAAELAVAEEEGMGGGESNRIDAVIKALDGLTGGFDSEHVAPTKHGGFCVRARAVGASPRALSP